MTKLILTLVVTVVAGSALIGAAVAQTYDPANSSIYPIGEKGTRAGQMCWVDTSGGSYFGYWAPCPPAKRNGNGTR